MAVRDEDRGTASAKPAELVDQAFGLGSRIDDDRFRGGLVDPDHVAIGADPAELIPVHCKAHEAFESNDALSPTFKITAVQSWNLREIETPGGTRSPVVLRSDASARAVLIVLEPGQALGDHQMKERALVSVVDGSVRVESGGETIEGGEGCFSRSMLTSGGRSPRSAALTSCSCSRRGRAKAITAATQRPTRGLM